MDIHSSNINFQSKINFVSDCEYFTKINGNTLFKEIPFIKNNNLTFSHYSFFIIPICTVFVNSKPEILVILNHVNNEKEDLFFFFLRKSKLSSFCKKHP